MPRPVEVEKLPRLTEEVATPLSILRPYISADQVQRNLDFLKRVLLSPGLRESSYRGNLQKLYDYYSHLFALYGDDLSKLSQAPSINTTLAQSVNNLNTPLGFSLSSDLMSRYIEGRVASGNENLVIVANSHALTFPVLEAAQRQHPQRVRLVIVDRHLDTYYALTPTEWRQRYPDKPFQPDKASVVSAVLDDHLAERVTVFGMESTWISSIRSLPQHTSSGRRRDAITLVDSVEYEEDDTYSKDRLKRIVSQMAQEDREMGITNLYLSIDLDGIRLDHTAIDYLPFVPLLLFSFSDLEQAEQEVINYLVSLGTTISNIDYSDEVQMENLASFFNNLTDYPAFLRRLDIPKNSEVDSAIRKYSVYGDGTKSGLSWEVFTDLIRELRATCEKEGLVFGLSLNRPIIAEITEADDFDVDGRTARLIQDIISLLLD